MRTGETHAFGNARHRKLQACINDQRYFDMSSMIARTVSTDRRCEQDEGLQEDLVIREKVGKIRPFELVLRLLRVAATFLDDSLDLKVSQLFLIQPLVG